MPSRASHTAPGMPHGTVSHRVVRKIREAHLGAQASGMASPSGRGAHVKRHHGTAEPETGRTGAACGSRSWARAYTDGSPVAVQPRVEAGHKTLLTSSEVLQHTSRTTVRP